jgi:hypothetical protein
MKKTCMYLCAFTALAIAFSACNNSSETTAAKFTDLAGYNLKGDVVSTQDSFFVFDSNGTMKKDSVYYTLNEYKDGNLVHGMDMDTLGKTSNTTIDHYPNGLWKGYNTIVNGKTIYKLDIQLDSAGAYKSAQSYDSTGKMDFYNTDIKMNKYGAVTEGKLYKADSSLVNSFVNDYDSTIYKGGTRTDSSGKVSRTTVKVNEHGDAIERTTVSPGKDSTTTKVTTYNYVYDSNGNWTQQTEIDGKGKPTKMTRRVITYATKPS